MKRENTSLGRRVGVNRKYLTEDGKFFKVLYCVEVCATPRAQEIRLGMKETDDDSNVEEAQRLVMTAFCFRSPQSVDDISL